MWDYDGLVGKTRLYFAKARNESQDGDEAFPLWLLLGLEFLLRAPLARINPTLLADPSGGGDAILHAAGFPATPGSAEPKSIQTKTVITRLRRVVDDFDEDRERDATFLTGIRNRELHTSESALALDMSMWLPPFIRVVDVICGAVDIEIEDILGDDIVKHGRMLVDKEDKKLAHQVSQRIKDCRLFFENLRDEEVIARKAQVGPFSMTGAATCPACECQGTVSVEPVRTTNERIEDGEIISELVSVLNAFACVVCGLELNGTTELKCAGLPQQYVVTRYESFYDRFIDSYEPDDYGNE